MHEQQIIDDILAGINTHNCEVRPISLVCSAEVLRVRLSSDIEAGKRTPDIIERSISRIPLYEQLDTIKVDVSELTAQETADAIMQQ